MRKIAQHKPLMINIIKNAGIIFLNAFVLAIGMVGAGMTWLMIAAGHHCWIDYCALLIGFALTFKTSSAMYKISRYPHIDLRSAPKILWQSQWDFIRGILISSTIIIPLKICANIFSVQYRLN